MLSFKSTVLAISCLLLGIGVQTEAIAGYYSTPDCWRAKTENACEGASFLRKGCLWCNGLCKPHGACHLHKRCSALKAGTPLEREICIAHGCKVQDRKCVKASEARTDPDEGICPPEFPNLKVVWKGKAPFCKNAKCPGVYRELARDKRGDGAKCLTGTKAKCGRCCRTSVVEAEQYWWGKGPACRIRRCPPGWKPIKHAKNGYGSQENRIQCDTGVKYLCERMHPRTVEECMWMWFQPRGLFVNKPFLSFTIDSFFIFIWKLLHYLHIKNKTTYFYLYAKKKYI